MSTRVETKHIKITNKKQKNMEKPGLNNSLTDAVDLFVMRKFEDCFKACCAVIKAARCEPEHERNLEVIEASAALGIQALAETDMWDQAVAFIKDVYGTVDVCPPRIIQVCILLHAHVREYMPCHGLVQIWLHNPRNRNSKHCAQVIRVFAQHILIPTGRHAALKDLVSNCSSLTVEERESLLQLTHSQAVPQTDGTKIHGSSHLESSQHISTQQNSLLGAVRSPETEDTDITQDDVQDETTDGNPRSSISDHPIELIFNQVCHYISVRLKVWRPRFAVLIMAVLAVLALIHAQTHDPVSSLSRLVILWREFFRRIGLIS